jgi:DNA-binding MarR family transcriptional regulator
MATSFHPEPESLRENADLVRLIGQVRRQLRTAAARTLAVRNESIVAWSVLNRLTECGPVTQGELADLCAQHPASISRELDALERKGLTTRARDSSDRRRSVVELTSEGRRWCRSMRPLVERATGTVLRVLRPAEQRALSVLLRRVLA